jgi:hypothetical protein
MILPYDRAVYPAIAGKSAWSVSWLITAPWAHPFWSQYQLVLVDLTADLGKPPILYRKGMTHEFTLWALQPDKRYDLLVRMDEAMAGKSALLPILTPQNQSFQFPAESNEAAEARMQAAVDEIHRGELSPDTDFNQQWRDRFAHDGVSLRVGENNGAIESRTE